MKKKPTSIYCFLFLLTLLFTLNANGKKRCKPFLEKLHNIQKMQRQGYSLKRGQSLRIKEDQARDKWWQCENISLAKFTKKQGKKKKSSRKKIQKVATRTPRIIIKSKSKRTKRAKVRYMSSTNATFNQTSAIVIKSKYQGNKNSAWLAFYQKPTKCLRPKSFAVFAYCTENRREQQSIFEQSYTN
jgi:hypothetical protein